MLAAIYLTTQRPEVPMPKPPAGQMLVRAAACGINHPDVFVRRGLPGVRLELPTIPRRRHRGRSRGCRAYDRHLLVRGDASLSTRTLLQDERVANT
jgi:hypothetical protein